MKKLQMGYVLADPHRGLPVGWRKMVAALSDLMVFDVTAGIHEPVKDATWHSFAQAVMGYIWRDG